MKILSVHVAVSGNTHGKAIFQKYLELDLVVRTSRWKVFKEK